MQHHEKGLLASEDVELRINVHYGVPSTASILAFDSIQRLLAIGTLDGRIKVIGGDNIEGLLISPKLVPYKYLEFLQNQGFLVSITNDNDIQVWNLQMRSIACSLQWESNVTAFSVINGSSFMYVGDEYGLMSVLKYDSDSGELLKLHYQLSSDSLAEATGFSISSRQPIVGLLPQPCSSGNRLLIAYESGLIILWDVVEAHVVTVRGDKVLQLKNKVFPPNDIDTNIVDDELPHDLEKEISALCWASTDGSILAVGYIDGDILFWNTSKDSLVGGQETRSSSNVVKLQLSSAEKRLPVIVLHWLDDSKSSHCPEGQLLVYGGDEIGCEEVVTVLSLEWSSGMKAVRCIGRVDLTLTGSFADMILIPSAGTMGSDANVSLFVLSNPGRIHIYDRGSLSSSDLQSREEKPISAINFPAGIPTVDPQMTVAELFLIHGTIEGIEPEASFYATYAFPVPYLFQELSNFTTSIAAMGQAFILLQKPKEKVGPVYLTTLKLDYKRSSQVQGPRCEAVFNLYKSGVQALKFTNSGFKLIIGYECSRIAVIDVHSLSVAFITESISNSPVISVLWKTFAYEMAKITNESVPKIPDNSTGEHIFILTKDASIYVTDGCGMITSRPVKLKKSTAISLYFIESQAATLRSVDDKQLSKDGQLKNELSQSDAQGSEKYETEEHSSDKIPSAQSLKESFILLCCNDSLRIYPAKSVVQEFSFMSDLRWNFKANMERMISSTENGHIVLANGSEVAFISPLVGENDFRIPESLPNLHDEVLEAAANAAISVSSDPKRKQGGNLGILGGIVKGFKGRRSDKPTYHDSNSNSNFDRLEEIFMTDPFPESSTTTDEQGAAELTIDDIVIDEPVPLVSTSSHEVNNKDKGVKSEREKLLDDGDDVKPRLRTREEIIATYRKAGDASSVAGQARNKLLERQEKLESLNNDLSPHRDAKFISAIIIFFFRELVDELKTYGMEPKTLHL
ncbi:Syntaxin-binding protein 5 [Sesamum angolense]|uniref:Syntaxin-binding protein 5 n=1 Tax=Sesamum angolense TaxID=2727404 RepID=A0AAE2BSG6_9LAMI|nr:Syntaxin-binding protein 5 [Sesamum angolense]